MRNTGLIPLLLQTLTSWGHVNLPAAPNTNASGIDDHANAGQHKGDLQKVLAAERQAGKELGLATSGHLQTRKAVMNGAHDTAKNDVKKLAAVETEVHNAAQAVRDSPSKLRGPQGGRTPAPHAWGHVTAGPDYGGVVPMALHRIHHKQPQTVHVDSPELPEVHASDLVGKEAAHELESLGDKAQEESEKSVKRMQAAPGKMPGEASRDAELVRNTFMPDWRPKPITFIIASVGLTVAGLWFLMYFARLMHHDRDESIVEEAALDDHLAKNRTTMMYGVLSPFKYLRNSPTGQIVLVFHNPSHESWQSSNTATASSKDLLDTVPHTVEESHIRLDNFKELCDSSLGQQLTIGEARETFLQDFLRTLAHLGFSKEVFSSVDKTTFFVVIGIQDDLWVQKYLTYYKVELCLRSNILPKLNIGPATRKDSMTPPSIVFDKKLIMTMAKKGIIDKEDPRALYAPLHTHHHSSKSDGDLLQGMEMFRIVYQTLSRFVHLDKAQKNGLILDWYPVHQLSDVSRIAVQWISMERCLDWKLRQPIRLVRDYFGPRIAFSFAWMGVFCKALLGLLVVAVGWEISMHILHTYYGVEGAHRQMLAFSLIIMTWAKIALNLWNQEEQYFLALWHIDPSKPSNVIRSDFHGDMKPAAHDQTLQEVVAPEGPQFLRWASSNLVVFFFICTVFFCNILLIGAFRGDMKGLASLFLAAQIKIFEFIFNKLAAMLTEWENHKYMQEFFDNLLWKQFFFVLINNYSIFFYIAVKQRHTEHGCPNDDCVANLRDLLVKTVFLLSLSAAAQAVVGNVLLRLKLWNENRRLETVDTARGKKLPKRAYVAEQFLYAQFRTQEQIIQILQCMIALGYVLLFGCLAPIIIPAAFFVFAVQIRSTAILLVTSAKRTVPRKSAGIGAAWRTQVVVLTNVAVLFAAFLFATYGDALEGAPVITKLTTVFLYLLAVAVIWQVVNFAVPPNGKGGEILAQRRARVLERLQAVSGHEELQPDDESRKSFSLSKIDNIVMQKKWEEIEGLDQDEGEATVEEETSQMTEEEKQQRGWDF